MPVDMEPSAEQLEGLFSACDLDGSGYLDENELAAICPDLSGDEIAAVFQELDKDGDGRISVREFENGFKSIGETLLNLSRKKRRQRLESVESLDDAQKESQNDMKEFLGKLEDGFTALTCQEQVCEFYQQLHSSEVPLLLTNFEDVLLGVIRDVRQYQVENERLEQLYKKERDQHEIHLRQLEEETESQMAKVELRIKKQEKNGLEQEKDEIKRKYEAEIVELQANLKRLQKLEEKFKKEKNSGEAEAFKKRIEELTGDNRGLKNNLTEAQTNLAIIRSELATLRQEYEEKCREIENDKETLMDYIKEQDNLTRQLHLLHEANKKLHDTNDDLRGALENARMSHRRTQSGFGNSKGLTKQASILSNYLPPTHESVKNSYLAEDSKASSRYRNNISRASSGVVTDGEDLLTEEEAPSLGESLAACDPVHRQALLPSQESCEVESLPEDFDSGHSTMRDTHDGDSDENMSSVSGYARRRDLQDTDTENLKSTTTEGPDTEIEMATTPEPFSRSSSEFPRGGPGYSSSRRDRSGADTPDGRSSSRSSDTSRATSSQRNSRPGARRKIVQQKTVDIPNVVGEPERIYKVVLAGDAAVGKSSFIMRLCKNKFVNNLNSTLGVDFQTKTIKVDGRIIALQLWDTAGQERFRSISKSYFRKADGVLLLYDTTYEKSFINVREWVETVEDSCNKEMPMMIVGNKIDLRAELETDARKLVQYEDGKKLAKEYNGLFCETSAKDGSNVLDAVTELARLMANNEDKEVQNVGLQLHEGENEEKKMFGNCC